MHPVFLLAVFFLAILTHSLAGFGLGLIAMAVLAETLGAVHAAALVALVAITSQVIVLARYRSAINLRAVRRLVVASLVGVPLGVVALRQVNQDVVLTLLGVIITAYALYALFGPYLPEIRNPRWAYGFGFLGGLLSGAYNTGGPPFVIYGTCSRWQPAEFRSNLQGIFLVNSIMVISAHALQHNFTALVWHEYLIALPAIGLALWLGFRVDRYLNPALFRKIVLVLLVVLGLRLIF